MPTKRRRRAKSKPPRKRLWLKIPLLLAVPLSFALALYVLYLDQVVQAKFEGKRWSVPSRVYARAIELYPQKLLTAENLLAELKLIGYQPSVDGRVPGTYLHNGKQFVITTRAFRHWDSVEPGRSIALSFESSNNQLATLADAATAEALTLIRLEPMLIGLIYPAHREDRILVRLDDLPSELTLALQAIEDRKFASHHGIDLQGIARAAWANLRASKVVQGGSTLTQQLVKNFYLGSERTLTRKFNEAIMSVLLELRYDKQEILEAYANEIYLGQDGNRAIHGFGLAAQFYFNKPSQELTVAESALLVAILRGPAYYNPRRHPERALERRNHVIEILWRDGQIDRQQAKAAQAATLGVTPKPNLGNSRYPAFIGLVKRQLQKDYRDEDLRSEGLRIFTTLDPIIQHVAEDTLITQIKRLERQPGMLEGGVVISRLGSAEVSAVVGGRHPRFEGFNRAVDMQRPVGSLLKPALYLTALSQPQRYTLASLIDDAPLELKQSDGSVWSPANYDHENHGNVLLAEALIHSYNQAAVQLGLELGLPQVVETLHALGIEKKIPPYPAVMLGSLELSPLDITQMYQTLGDEGFFTPLRAVREVLDAKHQPLHRYSLDTEQRFAPGQTFLVKETLRMALHQGTGQSVGQQLPTALFLAGKTGTTDGLRDSWFAGFGSDYVGVVWLGNDDNAAIGLTGASGALPVWADIMRQINVTDAAAVQPVDIEYVSIDPETGLRADVGCNQRYDLPFITNTAPAEYAPCAGGAVKRSVGSFVDRVKGLFR